MVVWLCDICTVTLAAGGVVETTASLGQPCEVPYPFTVVGVPPGLEPLVALPQAARRNTSVRISGITRKNDFRRMAWTLLAVLMIHSLLTGHPQEVALLYTFAALNYPGHPQEVALLYTFAALNYPGHPQEVALLYTFAALNYPGHPQEVALLYMFAALNSTGRLPRPPARGGPTLHVCRLRATLPVASLPIFAFYPCFTCSRHYRRNIKTFHRV